MTAIWVDPVELGQIIHAMRAELTPLMDTGKTVYTWGDCGAPREVAARVAAQTEEISVEALRAVIVLAQSIGDLHSRATQILASEQQQNNALMLAMHGPEARIAATEGTWTLDEWGQWRSPIYTVTSPLIAAKHAYNDGFGQNSRPTSVGGGVASNNPQIAALRASIAESNAEGFKMWSRSGNGVSYLRGGDYQSWDTGRIGSASDVYRLPSGRLEVLS